MTDASVSHNYLINAPVNVEVYSEPSGPTTNPGYRQHHTYRAGELIPLVIGGQSVAAIAARDLLV